MVKRRRGDEEEVVVRHPSDTVTPVPSREPALGDESSPEAGQTAEPPETGQEAGEYGLHIRLSPEIKKKIQISTELAFEMGEIDKQTLVELMALFIDWGIQILYKKWLARIGYR